MVDKVDRIVERAIAHTLAILTTSQQTRIVAREGIEKIFKDLDLRSPGHPGLARLKAFMAELDRPIVEH